MNSCDDFIAKLDKLLPEICTIHDLIRTGIVSHRNTMEQYRKKNLGPPFLRISERKIFYPKNGVLKWLKESSYAGSEKTYEDQQTDEDISIEPELV